MEIPIPFALSLILTTASIEIATKMMLNKIPIAIIMKPVGVDWYNNIGIPAPTKKDKDMEAASPENKLNQIVLLFNGWLTSNSMNSELL